ncbi:MAG: hypothetical protein KDA65_07990 [Planctomycetaceae bacterium]|nr:hypothetical protein [Planctomycetaceae bacterium]
MKCSTQERPPRPVATGDKNKENMQTLMESRIQRPAEVHRELERRRSPSGE